MDAAKRLNWSTLKHIAVSPKLLRWRADHPRPDTEALRLGRAIHCAILEPDQFAGRWVAAGQCAATTKAGGQCSSGGTIWHGGQWWCRVRGHAPEGTGLPPDGIEVIDREALELAKLCAINVHEHPIAAGILSGGHAEEALEWVDPETGTECRGRLDYLRPDGLADLKSTRHGTVREFSAECARNLYHGQLAWYHDGAIAAGRLPKDAPMPHIIAVSTSEPYDVAAFRVSDVTLDAGRILCRDLLAKYLRCRAADWWPGIAPDLETLEIPPWAPGMNGSEELGGDW